ncbi:MAG: DUF6567 family protein [Cyclobacteriaceae bacterium]
MKNLFLVWVVVGWLFTSCSYHVGTIGGGSAVITDSSFSHIDFAYGTARTVNVLGIGGNQKDALVLEAKRNLYQNYKLQPKQAIGQTVVDFKRTIFLPVLITKVTVSAEIIDFSSNTQGAETFTENLNEFTGTKKSGGFVPGTIVSYVSRGDTLKARILSRTENPQDFDNPRYTVQYYDHKNRLRIKMIAASLLQYPEEVLLQESEPLELEYQGKLYTPKNPENRLVRFRYEGQEYTGEFFSQFSDTYVIRMERDDGKKVGIYVKRKAIME